VNGARHCLWKRELFISPRLAAFPFQFRFRWSRGPDLVCRPGTRRSWGNVLDRRGGDRRRRDRRVVRRLWNTLARQRLGFGRPSAPSRREDNVLANRGNRRVGSECRRGVAVGSWLNVYGLPDARGLRADVARNGVWRCFTGRPNCLLLGSMVAHFTNGLALQRRESRRWYRHVKHGLCHAKTLVHVAPCKWQVRGPCPRLEGARL